MAERVLAQTITFHTVRVRVPASGEVRLPGRYPHEFASMPESWRTVSGVGSKFVDFPALDPASLQALNRSFLASQGAPASVTDDL